MSCPPRLVFGWNLVSRISLQIDQLKEIIAVAEEDAFEQGWLEVPFTLLTYRRCLGMLRSRPLAGGDPMHLDQLKRRVLERGTTWCKNSSRFAVRRVLKLLIPVRLPPGRPKLATNRLRPDRRR